MAGDELIQERHGAVVVLRLNRPEARNALNPSLIAAFGAAILELEDDDGTRALVVTGTGDRAFSGGMDLRSFADGDGLAVDDRRMTTFLRFMDGRATLPVVGAANATAVAGGLEILLGCDLVVAADGARFGLPEVQRGLIPGGGGTLIGTRIPLPLAMELVLTGESVDADWALRFGLVNAVVPAEQVLPTAIAYAERIAANGPLAVRAAKELVRTAAVDGSAVKARLDHWLPVVFASADAREGARAYVEKRAPVWKGS
ncbi:MAG: enoyl-CoA hydratase-related protein [Acidimicrobiales bacterium]